VYVTLPLYHFRHSLRSSCTDNATPLLQLVQIVVGWIEAADVVGSALTKYSYKRNKGTYHSSEKSTAFDLDILLEPGYQVCTHYCYYYTGVTVMLLCDVLAMHAVCLLSCAYTLLYYICSVSILYCSAHTLLLHMPTCCLLSR
jgi:hypothetical protein